MTSGPMSPRRATGILLLFFGAVEFVLRWPVLTGVTALYERDLFLLYYPLVQSVLRAVSDGALPLRDPTSAFGQSILGDPESQLLYPPAWLHLFLSPAVAYAWFVSIHSVFGALGAALLCRRLSGASLAGPLLAGIAWLLSGPLQSLATLWHHMSGAAWIPWVLLAVEKALESPGRNAAIRLGAILGAQMVAGSADMCAMTVLLAALRILVAGAWRPWRTWLGSGALGAALSAGVWLPALESLVTSGRAALPESTRTFWSLHPLTTLEFFLPLPLSVLPLRAEWKAALFESREPFLGSMFLGALVFPLLLAALFDPALPRRVRLGYGGGALAGFLVALGKNSLSYSIFVTLIPPLGILRYPSKAMIPVAIFVCLLAGVGVGSLQRSRRSRNAALGGIAALGALTLLLLGPLRASFEASLFDPADVAGMDQLHRNLAPDLLVTLGLLGLLLAFVLWPAKRFLIFPALLGAGWQSAHILETLNATVPAKALAYKPEHIEQLRPSGSGRVMVYEYQLFEGAARKHLGTATLEWSGLEGFDPDAAIIVAAHAYLAPLTGGLWGFEYAWDADLRLLLNYRLAGLTKGLRAVEGTPGFLKLLQVSGVEKVAALHEAGLEGLRLLSSQKTFHREPLRVFEVPDPLPRAYLTSGRRRASGADLTAILDPGFDPRTTVLLDAGPERSPAPEFAGTARVVERKADRLTILTSSSLPGFLTILEGALPGWRVWIDGRAGTVERANAIFVGTEVPAGTHRIEFRFLPTSVVAGVGVSALTSLLLILWAGTSRRPGAEPLPLVPFVPGGSGEGPPERD
jgi:hypothetical protein